MAAFRPSDASVGDSARYWGALVEIADSANPMIAVRDNRRQSVRHVAANKEDGRERLAFVNSL